MHLDKSAKFPPKVISKESRPKGIKAKVSYSTLIWVLLTVPKAVTEPTAISMLMKQLEVVSGKRR